jgi:serine/threonine protein kinase
MKLVETAKGLNYLHSQFIVHGDIRCVSTPKVMQITAHAEVIKSNILIDQEGHAKLTDFGLSVVLAEEEVTATTSSGPYRWNAPELFVGEDVFRTCESDIYAFGCTCLEVRVVLSSSTRGIDNDAFSGMDRPPSLR